VSTTRTQEAIYDALLECIGNVARTYFEFTSNHVWDEVVRQGGVGTAIPRSVLTPAIQRAVRQGICIKTQSVVRNPKHRSMTPVYQSLISRDRTPLPEKTNAAEVELAPPPPKNVSEETHTFVPVGTETLAAEIKQLEHELEVARLKVQLVRQKLKEANSRLDDVKTQLQKKKREQEERRKKGDLNP